MEHYEFELIDDFDKMDVKNHLEDATKEIILNNGGDKIEFELDTETFNKKFNEYTGIFEKYRIVKEGELIGYLEFFRSNSFDYLYIYTSPIN